MWTRRQALPLIAITVLALGGQAVASSRQATTARAKPSKDATIRLEISGMT
jgi:hypothetical protein